MGIEDSLFIGQLIRLGSIQHEADSAIESGWTHDPEYLRMLDESPARPRSASQVKKRYETIEKDAQENRNMFYFTIRARSTTSTGESARTSGTDPVGVKEVDEGHLIGFVQIYWIEWSHGYGWLKIGIGNPVDRGRGFGTDALRMVVRYAFNELNLFRLSAGIPGDNPIALHVFKKVGFVEEVRRREAIHRDGKRYDVVHLGILRDEWVNLSRDEP